MEVHVASEGVRYGSVDDEPCNGDSRIYRLGAACAGRRPHRYTSRRVSASLHCHGRTEYLLLWNASNGRRRPGKNWYCVLSHFDSGHISICDPAFGRKLCWPYLCYSTGKKALAENRQNWLCRLAAPLKAPAQKLRADYGTR